MTRRERLLGVLYATPRNHKVDERKERFAALNEFVQARGDAWLTSVPGAHEVTMECLPGSKLPDDLRALAYDVIAAGDGERVLPHQIVQRFVRRADGELESLTEDSTRPITSTVTHAGIVKVQRWAFHLF
jgi:hypothetical protein